MQVQDAILQAQELVNKREFPKAEKLLRQSHEEFSDSVDIMCELSRVLQITGRTTQAEAFIDKALALKPDYSDAMMLKGTLLNLRRDFQQAARFFQKAAERASNPSVAYTNLGTVERQLNRLEESANNFRKAIELNPTNFEAHYGLGFTLSCQGKIKEGILETLESIKINPRFMPGYLALGAMYTEAKKADVAEALYKEGIRLSRNAWQLHERLRDLYLQKQDLASARNETQILASGRGRVSDWIASGMLSLAAGDKDQAGKAFEKAIEVSPKSPNAHSAMAVWLKSQKRNEEATKHLQKAYELNPESPQAAFNLATDLQAQNRTAESRKLFEQVISHPAAGWLASEAKRRIGPS